MLEISLQKLLEAGCHFGHKAERWHPKASEYIYIEKDGIHIIDLVKTKEGLETAGAFVRDTVAAGGDILFVGTKRQARVIVKEECSKVNAPYFVERWIGGFMTNWDSIKKNIEKINRMTDEEKTGVWKKFPKHEQSKMHRYLGRLKIFYGGVLHITRTPSALFVIDVRKEIAAVREGLKMNMPVIGIVDTNSDPSEIKYTIPANDDAVGSISLITNYITSCYAEGKKLYENEEKAKTEAAGVAKEQKGVEKSTMDEIKKPDDIHLKKTENEKEIQTKTEIKKREVKKAEIRKPDDAKKREEKTELTKPKRGRPKKSKKIKIIKNLII